MRLSLRFVVPLLLVLTAIAYGIVPLVDRLTFRWFVRDLDIRASLVTNTMNDSLVPLIKKDSDRKIREALTKVTLDDRLYALAYCDTSGKLRYSTANFPREVRCADFPDSAIGQSQVFNFPQGPLHMAANPILEGETSLGKLIIVHDMSFVQRRSDDTKKYLFYLFIGLGLVVSLITVGIAQWSWKGWISRIRTVVRGGAFTRSQPTSFSPELQPILKDLRSFVKSLEAARRTRDESQISWSPKALKDILQQELAGDEILIVSNRQPYIHRYSKDRSRIEVQTPASGLVTALEPIMRACSGTWVAHGSGNADRDVVDRGDHVLVPPDKPSYQIRRVWLSAEEEKGYYNGFANEGLWPLCHIAHTRPVFRSEDYRHYKEVNQKFAQAVIEEAKTEDPVVLVQDYHFALLPRMIKNVLPKATIITFWHIPWPNPEAFGICPWREELLDGMLGSSILGFHTQFHCNNFIDTVDRFMECRIGRENATISYGGKLSAVHPYPISIEWPVRWLENMPSIQACRESVRKRHGMDDNRLLGVGVDRLDYTKGILERFLAVERLLELQPQWVGKFTFIQIAAPSRYTIDRYKQFDLEVREEAARINKRFGGDGYEPICLLVEHHEPDRVFEYFRAADLCFVTSLHDGMNLVAKEFVASRDDHRGVLILSQFTGASQELVEALIVNPYNIDQCAAALHVALEMPENEQRDRMRSMRNQIQEFNVYRWAGRMLIDASRLRKRERFMGKFGNSSLELPADLFS